MTTTISKHMLRTVLIGLMLISGLVVANIPQTAQVVLANNSSQYTLLAPLPCLSGFENTGQACSPGGQLTTVSLDTYLRYAYNLLVALGAVLAVFMIVLGGFRMITAEAWSTKSDAKEMVWNAVLGLLLVLGSYLILQTINPNLVKIDLSGLTPINQSSIQLNGIQSDSANYYASEIPVSNSTIQSEIDAGRALTDANNLRDQATQIRENEQAACESASDIQACVAEQEQNAQRKIDEAVRIEQNAYIDIYNHALADVETVTDSTQAVKDMLSAANSVSNQSQTALQNLQSIGNPDPTIVSGVKAQNDAAMQAIVDKALALTENSTSQLDASALTQLSSLVHFNTATAQSAAVTAINDRIKKIQASK